VKYVMELHNGTCGVKEFENSGMVSERAEDVERVRVSGLSRGGVMKEKKEVG